MKITVMIFTLASLVISSPAATFRMWDPSPYRSQLDSPFYDGIQGGIIFPEGYEEQKWAGLVAYLRDGRVELDNNLCENAIHPLKGGAKNYLFFGSARGGELGCVAYTLIENCKRHGLDLRSYLTGAMEALVKHGPCRAAERPPSAIAKALRLRKAS